MSNPSRPFSHECGPIRVQALSPTLVRLELRGPKGFEDRPTFHVVSRAWPGVPLQRLENGSRIILRSPHWSVLLPREAVALRQIRIVDPHGIMLFNGEDLGTPSSARPLPAPGAMPAAWSLHDRPRLVPPAWGATPSGERNPFPETSGWDLDNDAVDLYVFLPRGDFGHLRTEVQHLTGRTELPPLFMFGAFHSRYYRYSERGVLAMIREYRERRFPLDVFMLDTDWRVGGSFGYELNPHLFPDFQDFLQKVHRLGVHLGLNDHPKAMTKNALDPQEMEYRYTNLARFLWMGVDFWWFDRNWDVCLTGPLPVLCKEVWGMQVYHDMTLKAVPERRPLILANVDGIDDGVRLYPSDIAAHRYPFQWTGDTLLGWEEMRKGVENALWAGVHCLVPYISEDIGAHEGIPSAEFYLRHWQFAVLSAVVRPHASSSLYFRREPWTLGPAVEALTREYLNMRYRLLPHLYATARCNYDTGMPLLRRLDLAFPQHPQAAANDQYLLGEGLLVAPILEGEGCNPTVPAVWLTTPDGHPGILLEIFPNENLLGPPAQRWVEPQVDTHWNGGASRQPIPSERFSARWTGKLRPTRSVQLGLNMEEGGRLFMDGQPVFDHWTQDQWMHSACNQGLNQLTLEADRTYDLRLETRHGPTDARCQLFFRPMDLPAQPMSRPVWIPDGAWIDAWTGLRHGGPLTLQAQAPAHVIPMFIRAGSLFPLAPDMQHTGEKPWDPVTLEIYPSASRVAQGELYEDDQWSNAYKQGGFRRTSLSARLDSEKKLVTVQIGPALGPFQGAPMARGWVIRLHASPELNELQQVSLDGGPPCPWRLHPAGHPATPFQNQGPALDGEVVEVVLPAVDVGRGQTVTLHFR